MTDNSIYSKIEYQDAKFAKKQILESQINLLNLIQNIESYKDLRKKELLLKLKLKNNLNNVKENLIKLNDHLPQTKGSKNIKLQKSISLKTKRAFDKSEIEIKSKKSISIESELEDIKRKLSQLG